MIKLILLLIIYQISPQFVHSFPSQPESNGGRGQHQPLSAAPKDTCLSGRLKLLKKIIIKFQNKRNKKIKE
jgi:hypothetical protein